MNLPASTSIKVKEVPLWSIAVFVLGLVFTGGQLYAQQQDLIESQEKLENKQDSENRQLRESLKRMERVEFEALAQIKIINSRITDIQKVVERLEDRTASRYESK